MEPSAKKKIATSINPTDALIKPLSFQNIVFLFWQD